jgi:hypothetical protein
VDVVEGEADLFEVVGAPRPGGRLPHPLHRRQQQPDQHREDGDDDQQLDEGESRTAVTGSTPHSSAPGGDRDALDGQGHRANSVVLQCHPHRGLERPGLAPLESTDEAVRLTGADGN